MAKSGANLATVLFVRKYTLHRTIIQASKAPSSDLGEAEKGGSGKETESTTEKKEEQATVEDVADQRKIEGESSSPRTS